jgi:hypothetical protein
MEAPYLLHIRPKPVPLPPPPGVPRPRPASYYAALDAVATEVANSALPAEGLPELVAAYAAADIPERLGPLVAAGFRLLETFVHRICDADGAARRGVTYLPRARSFDPQTNNTVEFYGVPVVVLASGQWLARPDTDNGRVCWYLAKLAFDDGHDVLEDGEFIGAPHGDSKWMVRIPQGNVDVAMFIAYGGDISVPPDPVRLLSVARSRLIQRFGGWRAPVSEAELLRVLVKLYSGPYALVIRGAFVILLDGHWRGLEDATVYFARLLRSMGGITCFIETCGEPLDVIPADACFVSESAFHDGVALVVSPGAREALERQYPSIAAACTPAAWTPECIGGSVASHNARCASQTLERDAKKPRA